MIGVAVAAAEQIDEHVVGQILDGSLLRFRRHDTGCSCAVQSNGTGPAKLRLEWREQGGPPVATPPRPGYGTTVIRNLIPYELGGMVELMYRADGVCCTIEIAIENDTGPR
jgi:two-component sensor histidine kinase